MENIDKLRNFMKSSFSTKEYEVEYELSDQQKNYLNHLYKNLMMKMIKL